MNHAGSLWNWTISDGLGRSVLQVTITENNAAAPPDPQNTAPLPGPTGEIRFRQQETHSANGLRCRYLATDGGKNIVIIITTLNDPQKFAMLKAAVQTFKKRGG